MTDKTILERAGPVGFYENLGARLLIFASQERKCAAMADIYCDTGMPRHAALLAKGAVYALLSDENAVIEHAKGLWMYRRGETRARAEEVFKNLGRHPRGCHTPEGERFTRGDCVGCFIDELLAESRAALTALLAGG